MNAVARATTTVSASALRRGLGSKRFNPLAAAPKAVASKKAFSVQANSSKSDGPPLYAEGELDIYRESPLRYMGYSNEVGEAFERLADQVEEFETDEAIRTVGEIAGILSIPMPEDPS